MRWLAFIVSYGAIIDHIISIGHYWLTITISASYRLFDHAINEGGSVLMKGCRSHSIGKEPYIPMSLSKEFPQSSLNIEH